MGAAGLVCMDANKVRCFFWFVFFASKKMNRCKYKIENAELQQKWWGGERKSC